jgi:hypothetical protein
MYERILYFEDPRSDCIKMMNDEGERMS